MTPAFAALVRGDLIRMLPRSLWWVARPSVRRGLRAFMFNRFSITRPTCDGQTDRQTDGRTDGRTDTWRQHHASIASHFKKWLITVTDHWFIRFHGGDTHRPRYMCSSRPHISLVLRRCGLIIAAVTTTTVAYILSRYNLVTYEIVVEITTSLSRVMFCRRVSRHHYYIIDVCVYCVYNWINNVWWRCGNVDCCSSSCCSAGTCNIKYA